VTLGLPKLNLFMGLFMTGAEETCASKGGPLEIQKVVLLSLYLHCSEQQCWSFDTARWKFELVCSFQSPQSGPESRQCQHEWCPSTA
jgi:hypothetical protein